MTAFRDVAEGFLKNHKTNWVFIKPVLLKKTMVLGFRNLKNHMYFLVNQGKKKSFLGFLVLNSVFKS